MTLIQTGIDIPPHEFEPYLQEILQFENGI